MQKIGFKKINIKYLVSWNAKLNQIEVKLILKKNIIIKMGSEKFILEKNEQILLSRSVKSTEWSITKLLSKVGFRTELLTTTKDRGYLLSMVQPTKYRI